MNDEKRSIKVSKRRIRDLKTFKLAAEIRLNDVEIELEKLTEEDIEAGWGEAFEREWDMLSHTFEMASEVSRMFRA